MPHVKPSTRHYVTYRPVAVGGPPPTVICYAEGMLKYIRGRTTGTVEESLWLDADGSIIHRRDAEGWATTQGLLSTDRRLTVDEAREQFPNWLADIDRMVHGN
jgi:hypothetical protein